MPTEHVFVSYKREDLGRVEPLISCLRAAHLDLWWDRDLLPGDAYRPEITRALDDAACVIVIWSAASVASDWVQSEAHRAMRRGRLIPILLDDVDPPLGLDVLHHADLRDWTGDCRAIALRGLLEAIARRLQEASQVQLPEPTPEQQAGAILWDQLDLSVLSADGGGDYRKIAILSRLGLTAVPAYRIDAAFRRLLHQALVAGLNQGVEARFVLEEANRLRTLADPHLDPAALVLSPHEVLWLPPDGNNNPADFWMSVLNRASARGARMLGALLLAAPPNVTGSRGDPLHDEIVNLLRSLRR